MIDPMRYVEVVLNCLAGLFRKICFRCTSLKAVLNAKRQKENINELG